MHNKFIIIAALIAIELVNPSEASARKNNYKGTGIVAHRGFWNCDEAGYAKNSIAALRCAQQAGFWGSEFDVNMTADSVLIVFHDSSIDGKKIEKHNYADFKYFRLKNGEPIPTLEEYLEQAKQCPETKLVYELKSHSCPKVEETAVQLSIKKLKENGLLDPTKVMFISFSKYVCERLCQLLPDFDVQYLNGDLKPQDVKNAGIRGIDYAYGVMYRNKQWIAEARALGLSTNVWTVNKDGDIEAILQMHPDMLTTDQPLEAREIMKGLTIKEL